MDYKYPPGNGDLVFYSSATAASVTFSFTPRSFSRLDYQLTFGAQAVSSLVLTGLTAGQYRSWLKYTTHAAGTVLNILDQTAQSSFINGGTSASGWVRGSIWMPPAPELKTHSCINRDGTVWREFDEDSADSTNDPSAVVFTFAASVAYTLRIWGYK